MNLSPVEVIKKLYDTAIVGCKVNDDHLALKALSELVIGLNFEYADLSTGLFGLYQYCKQCIRDRKPEEAVQVLEELRSIWIKAFHLSV
jgi:hypothetical protein